MKSPELIFWNAHVATQTGEESFVCFWQRRHGLKCMMCPSPYLQRREKAIKIKSTSFAELACTHIAFSLKSCLENIIRKCIKKVYHGKSGNTGKYDIQGGVPYFWRAATISQRNHATVSSFQLLKSCRLKTKYYKTKY